MGRADERLLKIGEFARLTGGGYRLYGPEEAARLAFVKRAQRLGLSLDEIKELTDRINEGSRGKVISRLEEALESRVAETEQRMAELTEFRETFLRDPRRLFKEPLR
jgi:DNA-binding transcriptional MerR regulator